MLPLGETKATAAYREIRVQILDGTLQPGATMNQEALAASFGLSTTPIREALRRLEAEGLVTLTAHKDVVIASLTRRELGEVLNLRLELDPFAAKLAAENATESERDRAVELARAATPADPGLQLAANRLFHRTIYVASGNQLLVQILDSLWDRTDRYRLVVAREQRPKLVEHEHLQIAEAFKHRDVGALVRLVRRHTESARQLLFHFNA